MSIYAEIPKKFIYENRYKSDELEKTKITIGEKRIVILPKVHRKGLKLANGQYRRGINMDLNEVSKILVNQGVEIPDNDIYKLDGIEIFDTTKFALEYRVYHAGYDGGDGDHPDGWHVYCENVQNPDEIIDFYQDGFFTAIIRPDKIRPLNR